VTVPDRIRLPVPVDLPALRTEALALPESSWIPHFNTDIYEGQWSGVALRSPGGVSGTLYPDPAPTAPFQDTEILRECPAHLAFLHGLPCELQTVRLLALSPGAIINEHNDSWLRWEDGEVRIHIPIVTSGDVEFVLDGRSVEMLPGEAWYLNLNLPHRVANRSTERRIHLVFDCVVDDWLSGLMEIACNRDVDALRSQGADWGT
jgi:quercetin dioxygenase-like cupin family protein